MATPIRETAFEHEGQRYRIREQGGELTLQAKGRSSEWESLASGRAKGGIVHWRDLDDEALQGAAVAGLRSIGVLPAAAAAAPWRAPKKRAHIHCSRCGKPDHTVRNCQRAEGAPPPPAAAPRPAPAPRTAPAAPAAPAAPRGPFVVRPDGSVECPTLDDAVALVRRLRGDT